MSEYILIFAWIGIMFLAAKKEKYNRIEEVCGEEVRRCKYWFAFLAFAPVIWMAGIRTGFGDTGMYIQSFQGMPNSFVELQDYIMNVPKDKGFYLVSAVIKLIFGESYTIFFFIIAIIQGTILALVFRKYSPMYVFSIFLFVVSTDYMSWMHNGVRQFLAVTIILAATELMIQKKYIPLIFVILLAASVHLSALLMIPLVFIAQGEAWNQKTLLFITIALIAILFVGEFTNALDVVLEETQYGNVISDYEAFRDDGTSPIRVLIYSIPAIIAFWGRGIVKKVNDPLINFCTNMSIISAGLYLISMVTSGLYMGRLPIYASLYSYILLPWEIENVFNKGSRKILYGSIIVCYLIFYFYQMHFVWNVM